MSKILIVIIIVFCFSVTAQADNYTTKEICKNLHFKTQQNEHKKIHSVLTFQMSNGRLGCINRDKNAVNNMKLIVDSLLKGNGRPQEYCRKTESF